MRLRADMAGGALRHEDGTLLLAEKEREPIFLGPPLEQRNAGGRRPAADL